AAAELLAGDVDVVRETGEPGVDRDVAGADVEPVVEDPVEAFVHLLRHLAIERVRAGVVALRPLELAEELGAVTLDEGVENLALNLARERIAELATPGIRGFGRR